MLVEGIVGESHGRAADVHKIELVEGDEGYPFTVRRERRCVDPFDLMGSSAVEVVDLVRVLRADGFNDSAERDGGLGSSG